MYCAAGGTLANNKKIPNPKLLGFVMNPIHAFKEPACGKSAWVRIEGLKS